MIAWFDFYMYTNLWICYLVIQENNPAVRLNKAERDFFENASKNFL